MVIVEGFENVDRALRDLPKKIRDSAIKASGRKAAKPIVSNARSELMRHVQNKDGQSKAAYTARNIRVINSRSKERPGVYVGIKGRDVPVGDRFWDVRSYGILLGEGSYKGPRKHRGTGKNTGVMQGFENFIQIGAQKAGSQPTQIFIQGIDKEVNKAIKRAIG